MPSAFDGYEPNDYSHLGEDGDQSGSHAGYLRHKDNRRDPLRTALERIRDLKWVGPDTHDQMRQIAAEALGVSPS